MSQNASVHAEGDPEYGTAWGEGEKAYFDGKSNDANPYPKGESWTDHKAYLGWNDGHIHAPLN